MKTLAIRLEDELHTQLSVLAQLDGTTVTEAIRQAIEAHVSRLRTSPELSAKAQALLDDIEQQATSKKNAIAALFTADESAEPTGETGKGRRSRSGQPDRPAGS